MENVTSFHPLEREQALQREIENLLDEINEVRRGMKASLCRFCFETDEDLIDAWIFEQEFYEARYRYLRRRAKSLGIGSIPRLETIA